MKLSSEIERRAKIKELVSDLQSGQKVTDLRFDQIYSPGIRELSKTHWTPVAVALRAAELLVTSSKSRILDVGSGCGKFCTVAALSRPGNFIGIEQRPHLADAARLAAAELDAGRASFICGNMSELNWSTFDAFYLFNPFYENKMVSIQIDDTVSLRKETFSQYVETVRTKLELAPPGTKVATYWGFGGDMPAGYLQLKKEKIGTSYLELWVKTDAAPTP